jgi:hypothetical protein
MESMNFNNCTYTHNDRRKGGGGRGSDVEFLHFSGKLIIVLFYISMEECREGLDGG